MKRRLILSFVLLFSFVFQIIVPNISAQQTMNFDKNRYAVAHQKFVLPNDLNLIVHEDTAYRLSA